MYPHHSEMNIVMY